MLNITYNQIPMNEKLNRLKKILFKGNSMKPSRIDLIIGARKDSIIKLVDELEKDESYRNIYFQDKKWLLD